MKHLATATAALFLLTAPLTALAQTSDGSSNGGTNNGGSNTGSATDSNSNNNNGGGDTAGANQNGNSSDSQCSDMTPTANYDSFSEKCRSQIDTWVGQAPGNSVHYGSEVKVGTVLPDTVEIVEVPAYRNYGYVMLDDHRVLVDRSTRTVVRVY